jgi:hypothetical protein
MSRVARRRASTVVGRQLTLAANTSAAPITMPVETATPNEVSTSSAAIFASVRRGRRSGARRNGARRRALDAVAVVAGCRAMDTLPLLVRARVFVSSVGGDGPNLKVRS